MCVYTYTHRPPRHKHRLAPSSSSLLSVFFDWQHWKHCLWGLRSWPRSLQVPFVRLHSLIQFAHLHVCQWRVKKNLIPSKTSSRNRLTLGSRKISKRNSKDFTSSGQTLQLSVNRNTLSFSVKLKFLIFHWMRKRDPMKAEIEFSRLLQQR